MISGKPAGPPSQSEMANPERSIGFGGPDDRPENSTSSAGSKSRVASRIFDGRRCIGAVIEVESSGFHAWHKVKVGAFDTFGLAENAVRDAHRANTRARARRKP